MPLRILSDYERDYLYKKLRSIESVQFPVGEKILSIKVFQENREYLRHLNEVASDFPLLSLLNEDNELFLSGSIESFHSFFHDGLKGDPFSGEYEGLIKERDEPLRWSFRDDDLVLDRAVIMGILNVTPDSFSDGGVYFSRERSVEHALEMIAAGADIIDVGGESTRPGAEPVSEEEELERVIPVITAIHRESHVPISIDTYKPKVAEIALQNGASIVNDISGLRNPEMFSVVLKYQAGVVIMHMQGRPRTMQLNPEYHNVIDDIYSFLWKQSRTAVESGLSHQNIVIDPGIGFGKTLEQNYLILRCLDTFCKAGFPLLIGISRKSLIGRLVNLKPFERLAPSIALEVFAYLKGASILRVHDVKETVSAFQVIDYLLSGLESTREHAIEDVGSR